MKKAHALLLLFIAPIAFAAPDCQVGWEGKTHSLAEKVSVWDLPLTLDLIRQTPMGKRLLSAYDAERTADQIAIEAMTEKEQEKFFRFERKNAFFVYDSTSDARPKTIYLRDGRELGLVAIDLAQELAQSQDAERIAACKNKSKVSAEFQAAIGSLPEDPYDVQLLPLAEAKVQYFKGLRIAGKFFRQQTAAVKRSEEARAAFVKELSEVFACVPHYLKEARD